MTELWDVLDASGEKTGRFHERGKPMVSGDYHLIVHVWKHNGKGQWLIDKRSQDHGISSLGDMGGKWETTGGCAIARDSSLDAALRETKEELGLDLDAAKGTMWRRTARCGSTGHTWFEDVWIFEHDCLIEDIRLQEGETCEAMWASVDKIRNMMAGGEFLSEKFYPYFEDMIESFKL